MWVSCIAAWLYYLARLNNVNDEHPRQSLGRSNQSCTEIKVASSCYKDLIVFQFVHIDCAVLDFGAIH